MIQTITSIFNYINQNVGLIKSLEFTLNLSYFILFFAIIYLLFTFCLTYFIIKKRNKVNNIKYISLIKNWEYILFKNNLFKFYYSTIIILFLLLFKNSEILIQLNLIYILFFILLFIFIISIKLSNYFILIIFKLYLICSLE